MNILFASVYLVVAIAVITLVLLQGRGAGLGSAWGGGGEAYSTRRGVERVTFGITIGAVTLFFILSVAGLFIG